MIVSYNSKELDLLARIMRAEALNEGELGMLMVGNVVVNRVLANCLTFKNINSVYSFFYDNYAFDKKFIRRVILEEDTWRFNFIDRNVYEEKINYERKIMNDCGFKFNKKTNTWNKVK